MSHKFYNLEVSELVRETESSISVFFKIPAEYKENYIYRAGQYLTLKFIINGIEVRRAYSICTSPIESKLAVNVKRVSKGLVSNHIHDNIRVGDIIEVMEPDGNFGLDPHHELNRDLFFFASGSGITPIISIIKSVLEEEPKSRCFLLYGNKDEESIIFKDELSSLEQKYSGQLFITHTLTQPIRQKDGGLKGLFSRGKETWKGWKGRIDGRKIDTFLEEHPKLNKEVHYFVCGPGAMIDTLLDHLENSNISKKSLHAEHFLSSAPAGGHQILKGVSSQVKVHLSGQEINIEVPPEKTILDVLIEEKYDPPYSCTSGACSTCIAKLMTGNVEMDACYALDDDEVKDGYILVCQSRATSENVELTFDT